MAGAQAENDRAADAYVALPGGPGTLVRSQRSSAWRGLESENKACVLFDYRRLLSGIEEDFRGDGGKSDFRKKEDSQAGSGIRRSGRNRTLYRTIEQRAKKRYCAVDGRRAGFHLRRLIFLFVKTGRSGYHGTITKERRNVAIAIAERRTLCGDSMIEMMELVMQTL